ncbi:MAG: hypothetical protein JO247_14105, partial [Chloroflexi bacterium]|nr:hypothetical protein [Chloroflexota bacterium]
MAIPTMNFYPFVANAGNGGQGKTKNDGAFDGLLAAFATPNTSDQGQTATAVTKAKGNVQPLEQVLSALAGGKVDLKAEGLGLTAAQREQLAAQLEKLTANTKDGIELLASLLAAVQAASTALKPQDVVGLTKLLGVDAEGVPSASALKANIELLAQAAQLVASSDGSMTLMDAVKALTGPSDAFAQVLAQAMTDQPATSDPIPIDTGPPQAVAGSGQPPGAGPAPAAEASATAGSNGRELTPVATTGSPADGAGQEASQAGQPNLELLADVLQALVQAQGGAKTTSTTPAQSGAALQDGAALKATAPAAQALVVDGPTPVVPALAMAPVVVGQTAATAPDASAVLAALIVDGNPAVPAPVPGKPGVTPAKLSGGAAIPAITKPAAAPAVAAPVQAPVSAGTGRPVDADGDGPAPMTPSQPTVVTAPVLVASQGSSPQAPGGQAQGHTDGMPAVNPAIPTTLAVLTNAVPEPSSPAPLPARAAVEQAIVDQVVQ